MILIMNNQVANNSTEKFQLVQNVKVAPYGFNVTFVRRDGSSHVIYNATEISHASQEYAIMPMFTHVYSDIHQWGHNEVLENVEVMVVVNATEYHTTAHC